MAMNNLYRIRNSETGIQSSPNFIQRVFQACLEANQRTYLAAVTNPVTGRADPATERQVALMMLS